MARPRAVECGDHSFTTRANPRVLVRCPTCSTAHRAPAIDDPWPGPPRKAPASDVEPTGVDTSPAVTPPADKPGGVKVTRATKSTVAGTKTRAKRTSPKPATSPAQRPDDELTPAQQAGRRGGRAPAFLRRVGR